MSGKRVGLLALIAVASVLLSGVNVFAQSSGGLSDGKTRSGSEPSEKLGHARVAEILADRKIDWRNPQQRAQAAEQIRAAEKTNLERARTRAAAMGIPMQEVEPDGTVSEIVGLDENDDFIIYTTHNTNAGISSGANLLHEAPFGLDGSGVIVGVWDVNRPRFTHQEFGGRVTVHDGAEGQDSHHTHVAGTIGAKGVDPAARGMATNVLIHSRHWGVDASTMTANAATEPGQADKLYISNHSYGRHAGWRLRSEGWTWEGVGTDQDAYDPIYGRYDDMASSWDSIAYNAPYYLIFRSAGNSNDHNPTPGEDVRIDDEWVEYDPAIHPPGDGANGFANVAASANAKNVMVVGATTNAVSDGIRDPSRAGLGDFSSRGPTDDGRIKPDIVANGVNVYSPTSVSDTSYSARSGTSMSSPSAAGSAALLVQLYRDAFSGGAMRASTLKGLIIHTATDLGAYGLGNPGPDYQYGWGLINVHKAAELLMDHKENPSKRRLREDSLSTSAPARTYEFEWDGASPIRATLSWTDPAGSSTTEHNSQTPRLVNDLDLKIIAPDGTEYLPWVMPYVVSDDPDIQWQIAGMSEPATTGTNSTDNVEQVLIDDPQQAGTWQIAITHKGSLTNGEQVYSLLLSGVAGDPDELIFHSVSPYEADEGSVVTVDITGSGLSADTTIKLQREGESDIPGTFVEMIGNTLRCNFDLSGVALGAWDVVATNPDEQTHTLVGAFTVNIFGNVLFEEDFTGSDTLPDGWSQEELVGSGASWTVRNGGGRGFNPGEAYSGSRNVTLFTSNESDNIVRLYTPALNLSGYEDVVLRFQHHMQVWQGSQDELRVLYSTDGGTTWELLEEYTDNVDNWTLRELPLPSPGANYMIAFEGNALYGFGICIDDVQVVAYGDFVPPPGQLSITPAEDLTASGVEGGPFAPASQEYTLTNTGSDPMDWKVSKSEDWVSLSSPTNGTLESGGSTTVTVSINSAAESLATGMYSDTVFFTNTTDDDEHVTRTVSLHVQETYTVTFSGNGNTDGFAPDPQTKLAGVDLTLASNTGGLARTGYTFAGWNTQPDGSGVDYAEGAIYTTDADLTLYAKWAFGIGVVSVDGIRGVTQNESEGYYVDSGSGQAGVGGGGGNRICNTPIVGFDLPTLSAGQEIASVTLHYQITAYRMHNRDEFDARVYLLDSDDPGEAGTEFYYHGPEDTRSMVRFVGAQPLTDPGNDSEYTYPEPLEVSHTLSGAALELFESFYGGSDPTQSTAYFRFNRSTVSLADLDGQALNRFIIGTTPDVLRIEITTTGEPSSAYQSWLEEHYGDPNYDDSQMAASGLHTIRQAYVAGVNPTNATARFIINNAEMDTAERVLRWTGVEGRRYHVYWSSNLLHGAGFKQIASNIHWSVGAYTDTVERVSSESFYRISVELEE